MRRFAFALFSLIICFTALTTFTHAQVQAKYDVDRYDITARVDTASNSADITSTLKLVNNGNGPGRTVTLRLNSNAKVGTATVNGASATFASKPDSALQVVTITLSGSVAPKASVTVALSYNLKVAESAANAAISAGDVVLLPDSAWVPIANAPTLAHGQDQSPYTINLTLPSGEVGISGGVQKGSTFEQSINGEPLLLAGHYAQMKSTDGRFEALVPNGTEQKAAAQINRLFDEASRVAKFYEGVFGKPIVGPIRFVFASRAGGFAGPTVAIFNENIARMDQVDASTLEILSTTLAKNYIGGQARVYERGWGFISEALPRYLAVLSYGDRFGPASEREAFNRFVRAYAGSALPKKDIQLVGQTLASGNFFQSVPIKGPLVVRIFEREIGRDKMLGTIRQLVSVSNNEPATLETWIGLLKQTGNPNIDVLNKQWLEKVPNVDVAIGVPRQEDGALKAAVRNFGTGTVKVEGVATTASGKQLRDTAMLTDDSSGFGTFTFNTTEKISSVEVDPDKVLLQTNYDNDSWVWNPEPVQRHSDITLFNEAAVAYAQKNFGDAEFKLRQVLAIDPNNDLAHAWLGRALAEQNGKGDEAVKEAQAALAAQPPDLITIAWANYTIGQVAESRGQYDAALAAFSKAAQAQADFVSTKAARAAIIAAEAAGGKSSPVDPSVQQFISQLDKAIMSANSENIKPLLVQSSMKKFASRVAVAHPSQWNTTILRVETISADRVAVDIKLDAVAGGNNESGTMLYYLRRGGSGWQLEKIDLSNLK